jgi:hypothetical protein
MADIETQQERATSEAPITPPRPEKKATLRLGQRELSRISLAVILVIVAALGFGVYRLFLNFKSQRDIVIAQSNLLALHKAFRGYAEDWDGKLPPAEHWTDAVTGYLSAARGVPGGREALLQGPADSGTVGYVYNDQVAGYNLERPDTQKYGNPSRLVVLIEKPGAQPNEHVSIPPQDSSQGEAALYKLLSFPHYASDPDKATTLILFADGHIERRQRRDFSQSSQGSQ